MHLPLLIMQTGQTLPAVRARHGDFGDWMRHGMRLGREQVALCRVYRGEQPLPPSHYRAALVTGSASMVTERAPWSEACATWLREAHAEGMPLLGICYGHQLLAHALGGRVGYLPRGREMGTVEIICDANRKDALFEGMPARFRAHASHEQGVLEAPPGAAILASSAGDECQAFRVGARCWGLQFHPEFSAAVMRGYLHGRRQALAAEGRNVDALLAAVRPTPAARRILRRFGRLAGRSTP